MHKLEGDGWVFVDRGGTVVLAAGRANVPGASCLMIRGVGERSVLGPLGGTFDGDNS